MLASTSVDTAETIRLPRNNFARLLLAAAPNMGAPLLIVINKLFLKEVGNALTNSTDGFKRIVLRVVLVN